LPSDNELKIHTHTHQLFQFNVDEFLRPVIDFLTAFIMVPFPLNQDANSKWKIRLETFRQQRKRT